MVVDRRWFAAIRRSGKTGLTYLPTLIYLVEITGEL